MNEDMEYAFQETQCQFARTIQTFLQEGWYLMDIKYGERKFGFKPTLVASRNNETKEFSPDEIEEWVRREMEKKNTAFWKAQESGWSELSTVSEDSILPPDLLLNGVTCEEKYPLTKLRV